MTVEEIKRYFTGNPPPKEVNWKPYAKITDAERFLAHAFVLIENHKGKQDDCPAWWRLKEFYQFMKSFNKNSENNER
ncbi:DUF6965 family protein [Flavobacterium sp. AG291]|uniref:DUF6965 family protein n=1 Tax=Flavobacterium sp. AG291 TaxID=2184000 RepID=UPI000E0B2AEE|nr:hypothetical protein [Flavobacterium sp. AG291]RDI11258.1 hypothetical protein DEU42_106192 [Flavobacterium sp. AG291]